MTAFDATLLPSKTIPYGVKSIEMTPFKVPQIMMLSRAVALQTMEPVVEAMDSVMDFDARELTDGDFYYLLAWQRIQAYSISPLLAEWKCEGMVYKENGGLERVFNQEQLNLMVEEYDTAPDEEKKLLENPQELMVTSVLCDHENSVSIGMEHLETVYLDANEKLDPRLDYPRVRTLSESKDQSDNPDQQLIAQASRWVREGTTIKDKIAILESEPDLTLFEKALKAQSNVRHGIFRAVTLNCEKCNALSEHSFDIRPETFFDV